MQIITLGIVLWVVFKMLLEYESFEQKVKRMDNDPNCTIKSNDWYNKHPEYKKGGFKL